MKLTNYASGLWAEILTILFLFFKGYRVLAWRFKTRLGEIDIVARKANILAFVEVKSRSDMENALIAVNSNMRKRICNAGKYFVGQNPGLMSCDIRYDLVAVSGFRIQHLDNAWPHSA